MLLISDTPVLTKGEHISPQVFHPKCQRVPLNVREIHLSCIMEVLGPLKNLDFRKRRSGHK